MIKVDLYEVVTQKIDERLEAGFVPWQIPWRTKNGMPRNMISNRPYTGINFWMLLTSISGSELLKTIQRYWFWLQHTHKMLLTIY